MRHVLRLSCGSSAGTALLITQSTQHEMEVFALEISWTSHGFDVHVSAIAAQAVSAER